MSEIKRKEQSSGFQAGEGPFEVLEDPDARPDFSALEAGSGVSAAQAEKTMQNSEPVKALADETPAKKRYYSPGEVMKKKGCIGCGGMALAFPIMMAVLVLAVTLF